LTLSGPSEQVCACFSLAVINSHISERSILWIERFPHEGCADILIRQACRFPRGDLNRFHRLENRGVVFAAVVERPNVFPDFWMQRFPWNTPRTERTSGVRLFCKPLCAATEHPGGRHLEDWKECRTFEPSPTLPQCKLDFWCSIGRILSKVIVRPRVTDD
jgi:hypothetical protein